MEKRYIAKLYTPTGSGLHWDFYLVKDPQIKTGALTATIIGEFDAEKTESVYGNLLFIPCKERELILIGAVSCEEIDYDPFDTNPDDVMEK